MLVILVIYLQGFIANSGGGGQTIEQRHKHMDISTYRLNLQRGQLSEKYSIG